MCVDLPNSNTLGALHTLISLSMLDRLYADQYLHRAELLLSKFFPRARYLGLREDQEAVPHLTKELRHATERGEWSKVGGLAQQAANARGRLIAGSQILAIADAVYGARLISTDVTALALTGVVPQPSEDLSRTREAVLDQLRVLAGYDKERSNFYRARVAHFQGLQLTGDQSGAVVDPAESQKRILQALEAGDFARVKQLADSIADGSGSRPARLRAPRPADSRVRDLGTPFSDAAVDRARDLGLTTEMLEPVSGLNAYLSCGCADRATFPELPLTETHGAPESCTCGHPCPPDVRPTLRENLDFLMGHPFISSAGLRYLPWFGPETVLVETFSEADPDARTGMLTALGLPKRRGCARLLIEDALLTNGPRVCTELGLDPMEFVAACIPFDAYVRLAPKYGWGQQESWTHFDGYQITRELKLWALVGGHARFGGGDNLSALVRDYDSDVLTARFAILRRQRFAVRETQEAP